MKPFDLELAKKRHPVETKDGKPARIICFDVDNPDYPLAVLVQVEGKELLYGYTADGKLSAAGNIHTDFDLVMSMESKSAFVCLFRDKGAKDRAIWAGEQVFPTEESALRHAANFENFVAVSPIKWEEEYETL